MEIFFPARFRAMNSGTVSRWGRVDILDFRKLRNEESPGPASAAAGNLLQGHVTAVGQRAEEHHHVKAFKEEPAHDGGDSPRNDAHPERTGQASPRVIRHHYGL